MTKREKVIKGLECCTTRKGCYDCPYTDTGKATTDCKLISTKDALELLKEQELQREYETAVEDQQYCERYEPTYNPDDGSM